MLYDIVIIEDEIDLGNVISEYLKLRGFSVLWFKTASEALVYYSANRLDNKLVIIDIQLPDMNGFDLASEMVKINASQPFFFLTAHNEKQDRLRGLKIGAIDYISKPFEIEELVLRIGNIINKFSGVPTVQSSSSSGFINIGDIRYQKDQLFLQMPDSKEVSLTVRESEVLDRLAGNINQVVKKKDILLALWGNDDYFNGKSLEVFISRLRRLFKASNHVSIENVYGLGYILKVK
ncbi:response regulator transcription factor [Pedobacter riviphilus]|uniref:Response regulator transcription factor n=1 Tax=Pedobacter riviphilus TaxID=2766984 RepID=A0ABX6TFE7_9SPHI|nr:MULTISPECIES: response regulator transcription factor [Pedobacter]NII83957.1 DNA-binding response OmpR family regulator [Pedobacter sp. SG908]NMN37831.1 DNA-binding response OmpR family regulator [Pedobacter sp. SG918]QNR83090.1 response regulator transcription factor [Pedobacter riviphilus]